MSKLPAREQRSKISKASMEPDQENAATESVLSGGFLHKSQGRFAAGALMQMQRSVGNQALGRWLQSNREGNQKHSPLTGADIVQRKVVDEDGDEVTLDDIINYFSEHDLEQGIEDRELKREFTKESQEEKEITIEQFLIKIDAIGESGSEDEVDDDWDPADHAAEPMDPDGILSSSVRGSLSFNSGAKALMKQDTPKDKSGHYMCHICRSPIKKGESVDMDHLPPWKERLHAYIEDKELTEDDYDELTGPAMKQLYNMRGSVFAHSSCNRGHTGEGNYKGKWRTALNWFQAGGGAPFK
jgi:hypothetical protein